MFYKIISLLFVLVLTGGLWLSSVKRHPLPVSYITNGAATFLTANGYGGPIRLQIVLTPQGFIDSLAVLEHKETSSYIKSLPVFMRQFPGKGAADPLVLGQDIDAIAGATITSSAITRAVHESIHSRRLPPKPVPVADILIPLALCALAVSALLLKNIRLRWLAMFGGLLYFGLGTKTMFSVLQITNAGQGLIPSFQTAPLWWMLAALALIPSLILGRLYCCALCPFALIQEILAKLPWQKAQPSRSVDGKTRITKYIILMILLTTSILLGSSTSANIEPYITLFTRNGSFLAWTFLALILLLGTFYFRFWCRALCPAGALTGLTAHFAFLKIRTNSSCHGCAACAKSCLVNAITLKEKTLAIESAECILCGNCLRACPNKLLSLRTKS